MDNQVVDPLGGNRDPTNAIGAPSSPQDNEVLSTLKEDDKDQKPVKILSLDVGDVILDQWYEQGGIDKDNKTACGYAGQTISSPSGNNGGINSAYGVSFLDGMSDSEIERCEMDQWDIPAVKWREYARDYTGGNIHEDTIFCHPDITKEKCQVHHIFAFHINALKQGRPDVLSYARAHSPESFETLLCIYLDREDTECSQKVSPNLDVTKVVEQSRTCKKTGQGPQTGIIPLIIGHLGVTINQGRSKAIGTTLRAIVHFILNIFGQYCSYKDPAGVHGPVEVLNTCEDYNTFFVTVGLESLENMYRSQNIFNREIKEQHQPSN